jgi:dephospho-CoA kinase
LVRGASRRRDTQSDALQREKSNRRTSERETQRNRDLQTALAQIEALKKQAKTLTLTTLRPPCCPSRINPK